MVVAGLQNEGFVSHHCPGLAGKQRTLGGTFALGEQIVAITGGQSKSLAA